MSIRKILATSNTIYRHVKYKRGTAERASGDKGGVCRAMVLTWIHESHLGVQMNAMANVLTGGAFHGIAVRHESTKVRMRFARNEQERLAVGVSENNLTRCR